MIIAGIIGIVVIGSVFTYALCVAAARSDEQAEREAR